MRRSRVRSPSAPPLTPAFRDMPMKYLIMLSALGLVGCSVYSPDAGHEVVLIEKPWIFGHGGVDSDPVKPGRTFAAITTEGVDVYMQPQKFDTEMHDTIDRKSTRLNSSHDQISYAVFCLKKKKDERARGK